MDLAQLEINYHDRDWACAKESRELECLAKGGRHWYDNYVLIFNDCGKK